MHADNDSYDESGAADLHVDREVVDSLASNLGIRDLNLAADMVG